MVASLTASRHLCTPRLDDGLTERRAAARSFFRSGGPEDRLQALVANADYAQHMPEVQIPVQRDGRRLAPGVPDDYYRALLEAEERHWWHAGMRAITAALLRERLAQTGQRLLDAGCGVGGFLRWARATGAFDELAGVDVASAAIELAGAQVPEADLRVAPLAELPFEPGSFDVVVTNDVLQHVPLDEVDASVRELRRVLAAQGTLLVRTNGARRERHERQDWRAYSRASLRSTLERNGFRCQRVTYANAVLSLVAAARRRSPRAPTETAHGIPAESSRPAALLGGMLLRAEREFLARTDRSIPYGHTLFALASPRPN